jgi:hypothetical protein
MKRGPILESLGSNKQSRAAAAEAKMKGSARDRSRALRFPIEPDLDGAVRRSD